MATLPNSTYGLSRFLLSEIPVVFVEINSHLFETIVRGGEGGGGRKRKVAAVEKEFMETSRNAFK